MDGFVKKTPGRPQVLFIGTGRAGLPQRLPLTPSPLEEALTVTLAIDRRGSGWEALRSRPGSRQLINVSFPPALPTGTRGAAGRGG